MATQPDASRKLANLVEHCHHLILAIDSGHFGNIDGGSAFIMPLRVAVEDANERRRAALDDLRANDAELIGEPA